MIPIADIIQPIPTPWLFWKGSGSAPVFSDGFELENGSGLFLLENGGFFQLEH